MIALGGYLLLTEADKPGGFTVGTLLLFRAYWWRLFGPIQTLARVNDMIQRASAAGRRVFEILDAPEELPDNPDAKPLQQIRGELELRNVSFAYPSELLPPRGTGFQPVRFEEHGLKTHATTSPIVLRDLSLKI